MSFYAQIDGELDNTLRSAISQHPILIPFKLPGTHLTAQIATSMGSCGCCHKPPIACWPWLDEAHSDMFGRSRRAAIRRFT